MGRNIDWKDALYDTTGHYASGKRFETVPPDPVQVRVAPTAPPAPVTKRTGRKKCFVSSEQLDLEKAMAAPPLKRQRKDSDARVEKKYQELCELAQGQNARLMKQWLRDNYLEYANSISCTSKHQTLYILASLLL